MDFHLGQLHKLESHSLKRGELELGPIPELTCNQYTSSHSLSTQSVAKTSQGVGLHMEKPSPSPDTLIREIRCHFKCNPRFVQWCQKVGYSFRAPPQPVQYIFFLAFNPGRISSNVMVSPLISIILPFIITKPFATAF